MIKRIKDSRLSEVSGGNQSDAICICPTVCSCKQEKLDARTQANWPKVEFRNTKKFS